MAKRFLRSMAQPFDIDQAGLSLWSEEDILIQQQKEQDKLQPTEDDDKQPKPGEDHIFEGLEDQAMVDAMMQVDEDM